MMSGVVVGRIVHYILNDIDVMRIKARRADESYHDHGNPPLEGEHVPMIITNVIHGLGDGTVNGQCVLDGNDTLWVSSVKFDEKKTHGSWHWIEKV